MSRNCTGPRLRVISLILVALLLPAWASGQAAPRTAWGDPDLTGTFLYRSSTPLERPPNLGAKEFYTPEELVEAQRQRDAAAEAAAPEVYALLYDFSQFGHTAEATGVITSNRTSIITGPTGRVPPLLPAAQQRVDAERAARAGHEYDGPESRSLSERCIVWSFEGPPILSGGYNPLLDITQGRGYVAIRHEMMGRARVIPTDGREHLASQLRQYQGDSVGHWEGDTLVVDTTNFNDTPPLGRGSDRNLHVVERLTKQGDGSILYQYTVTDPTVWEESWSGEMVLPSFDGKIFEYACQEGNYGLANILRGARVEEHDAAQPEQ